MLVSILKADNTNHGKCPTTVVRHFSFFYAGLVDFSRDWDIYMKEQVTFKGGNNMRLSHILGKEIIDYTKGEKLGVLSHAEFIIDEQAGYIHTLEIPLKTWDGLKRRKTLIQFKWNKIYRVGEETILVDPSEAEVQSQY
jgi:YlmC/YmxH family sporulation protein